MKSEGSLPCSKEPSNGPYLEQDQSNPYPSILSLSLRSILILSSPYALVFLVVSFVLAFLFFLIRATCLVHLIVLTWSF
jgi:hypothetical protein